ncbi:LysM peptidoglycan-binding domain-containing protein [Saccharopolyspora sp. ASAGF58]|uniref:LysM peptidoglycan-binding domain-containing protein n=1 Tax=Saccharopolyspora sp. ASAGF58 TaxID=2719023 RepID=UPI00143FD8D0|nr:LysM peptidoglycan-binding domain-containing protein [Saccharopolyspora sp. ASAGF58]QIZ37898.1 LysM peptidoglycan-binding domain-containing protein [Saccharopolyspora sp. ASAGF58]
MTPIPPRATTAGRIRAGAAVLGLTVLLIGLPVVLTFAGQVITMPTLSWPVLDDSPWAPPLIDQLLPWLEDTWHALRLDLGYDGALLLLIVATGWGSWLVMLWWSLCDLLLLLRYGAGRARERVAAMGPRGWITTLVTAATFASTPSTVSAAPVADPVAVTAPQYPGGVLPMPHEKGTTVSLGSGGPPGLPEPSTPTTISDDLRPDYPRYEVARGDTLWGLAARHLGNPHRWPDIADLNTDRIGDDHCLLTGSVLLLPGDATHLPAPAVIAEDARWITVGPGDTLTAIAGRELGDPDRWQEIADLNAHQPQPDGRVLRDPDMLFPGWRLALPPAEHTAPAPVDHTPPETTSHHQAPSPEDHGRSAAQPVAAPEQGPGVEIAPGVFLGLGLAAATSAALVLARTRHRRTQRPGAAPTPDYPVAPTVYQLKLAHLRATQPSLDTESPTADHNHEHETGDSAAAAGEVVAELGVDDNATVRLDLTALGGLGLTGPGAEDAMRALILDLQHRHGPRIVLQKSLATELFPNYGGLPHPMEVTDDLTTATSGPGEDDQRLEVFVVRAPLPVQTAALLRRSHTTAGGVVVLALGPSVSGTTLTIDAGGIVTSAIPEGTKGDLVGVRMFTATPPAADDLLTLAHHVAPQQPRSNAAEAGTPSTASVSTSLPEVDGTCRSRDSGAAGGTEDPVSSTESFGMTETPDTNAGVLSLRVVGCFALSCSDESGTGWEITGELAPRQQELLTYLAVHPEGVARDTLIADLWHTSPPARPTNALNTALSRLRATLTRATHGLAGEIVDTHNRHLRLNPDLVDVDYHHFADADSESRRARSTTQRLTVLREIVDAYRGELGAGIDSEWIHPVRHAAQRTAINAISELARHHVADDPRHTLELLETATGFDPYNEHLYRDIMRLQDRLGIHDGIPRTLALLEVRLRDIDCEPAPETQTLATALQHRHAQHVIRSVPPPPHADTVIRHTGAVHPATPHPG